jgi:hypothetical protein
MNEKFTSASIESKKPNKPDYGRAIQCALDGYARDGATWLRARHIFHETIEATGSSEAVLRNALYEASEGAESTYEEATARFWTFIEGENGNHARYAAAIESALDGYAKDGQSWLLARDVFFDILSRSGTVRDAVNIALAVIAEGAESSVASAERNFWSMINDEPEAVVSVPVVDVKEAALSISEVQRPWPKETSEIGGMTRRIEYNEAAQIFERVEIRGDGRGGRLTPALLSEAGLLPRHRLEVEDRTIWFSPGYDLGGGRVAVIGYAQGDDGSIIARSYYRSNSQGIWRYLPQYRLSEKGKINWFSKGYGEESVTLPASLQESLTRAIDDDGGILQLDSADAQAVFSGTARYLNSVNTVYHRQVAEWPVRLAGVPEAGFNQLPPPETIHLTYEQTPKFDAKISSWQQETKLYGRVTCDVFPSNDGKLRYVFSRDEQGRAWVSSIENDSPLESTGLRRVWVSGGALTTPAEEYVQQAGNYGGVKSREDSHYVDMFANYLSKIPTIRDYLASVETRRAREG